MLASPGHSFSDVARKVVSIINLASVRAIENMVGQPVHPLRFRANLYVEGWPAWHEFDLLDRTLAIGDVRLKVVKRIVRCAAVNVDPDTAERDLSIPQALQRRLGHGDCGIYAEVIAGGSIAVGDAIMAEEPELLYRNSGWRMRDFSPRPRTHRGANAISASAHKTRVQRQAPFFARGHPDTPRFIHSGMRRSGYWFAAFADMTAMGVRDLAARCARGLHELRPPKQRAQGMPDARCTRGLVCNVHEKCAHEHTGQRSNPTFPAQWLYGL